MLRRREMTQQYVLVYEDGEYAADDPMEGSPSSTTNIENCWVCDATTAYKAMRAGKVINALPVRLIPKLVMGQRPLD